MENLVERRSVSLYPADWEIIDQSGASMGLSTSTALRVIVRQWAQHFQAAIQRTAAAESDADMDTRDQAQVAALAAANAALR